MNVVRVSKRLSYVLRHRPGSIGVALDDAGWTDVDALLAALTAHGLPLTRAELDRVVATNDKRRSPSTHPARASAPARDTAGRSTSVTSPRHHRPSSSTARWSAFSRRYWPRACGPDAGTRCTSARTSPRLSWWVDAEAGRSCSASTRGGWRPMVIPSRARRTASGWSTPFRRDTWRHSGMTVPSQRVVRRSRCRSGV